MAAHARRSQSLSASEARRVAISSQGFTAPRPTGPATARQVLSTARSLSAVQIDSVNVVARAHYFPFFSRLGVYDRGHVEKAAYTGARKLFEYWAHEASLLPVELWPLSQWRMRGDENRWRSRAVPDAERARYIESVYQEVVDRGPLAASELSEPGERSGPWWGWGAGKRALEWLFRIGRLTIASRRAFERVYDLPERVLPTEVLALPEPPEDDARRQLLARAARSLGVATLPDLADYFRQQPTRVRPIVADMVNAGELDQVTVEGWREPAYVPAGAVRIPKPAATAGVRALVSPFDSLVWNRRRVQRLFDFEYRIEIYVPAPKRVYGYYVYPFLLGDRLVGRVDLKADRAAGVLRAHAAFVEADSGDAEGEIAAALADELVLVAEWLGLADGVAVGERGDLAPALARALSPRADRAP